MGIGYAFWRAAFVVALALLFSSLASAAQFDLVLNCRSTGVIGFNTNGSAIGFDNAVNMMGG